MTRDLPLTSVYGVAIHPEDPSRVWVGSGDGQLWRTEDGQHVVGVRQQPFSRTTGGTATWRLARALTVPCFLRHEQRIAPPATTAVPR